MTRKICIIIMGPTAVGKTALAISLAQHFDTKIISADSRQCYRELNIGVAKPSLDELRQVPHYFINSHSVTQTVNAAVFEQYAIEKIREIFHDRDLAVMVGGTGLYIKSFCEGMDAVPEIPAVIRENITGEYRLKGLEWLQFEVQKYDPGYYQSGEIKNPQRLMRALEVKLATGKSILQFHTGQKAPRDFEIIRIGLELPVPVLYLHINQRVDAMIEEGLPAEVKSLESFRHLTALQTVGYRELFDHFDGKISFADAVSAIKTNTRHYAKRQLTWFKKDAGVKWCSPDLEAVLAWIIQTGLLFRSS